MYSEKLLNYTEYRKNFITFENATLLEIAFRQFILCTSNLNIFSFQSPQSRAKSSSVVSALYVA